MEDIVKLLDETIPSSGIEGAFGRYYVESKLDKPFSELPEPSYDGAITQMDFIFSVVLAYKYGVEKRYVPEYAKELFDKLESSGAIKSFQAMLKPEDMQLFKDDLEFIGMHRAVMGWQEMYTDKAKEKNESLAWYKFPEPDGKEYTEQDLEDEAIVKELFDYCQVLLATINKHGWKKLFRFHGLEKLLAINEESGWFDTDTRKEAIDGIKYQSLISGYDVEKDDFGTYDGKSGEFIPDKEKPE